MEHEPFSEFYTKLQDKLEFCKFPTPDFEMKHQIIQGCFSKKLRTHALSNPNLTLAEIVEKATIDENVQTQSELFKKPSKSIHAIKSLPPGYSTKQTFQQQHAFIGHQPTHHTEKKVRYYDSFNNFNKSDRRCFNCNGPYPHVNNQCPAKGKICSHCGKRNHFAIICRQRHESTVRHISEEVSDDFDSEDLANVWTLNTNRSKVPSTTVLLGTSLYKFFIDTGAECNVMDKESFASFYPKPTLRKCKTLYLVIFDVLLLDFQSCK